MAKIIIDGRTFAGNNISIRNGVVTIDGVKQDGSLTGVVEIRVVEGVLGQLETDASVSCGMVNGHVRAGGSVSCGDVGGSASAGGSISCGDVTGSVSSGGSVNMGRRA